MANIELLDKALENIKLHPDNWDQNVWSKADVDGKFVQEQLSSDEPELLLDGSCGTKFCLAGHVALVNGAKLKWKPNRNIFSGETVSYYAVVDLGNGEDMRISTYARNALDLILDDADALFYHANTLEKLERFRDKLASGYSLYGW